MNEVEIASFSLPKLSEAAIFFCGALHKQTYLCVPGGVGIYTHHGTYVPTLASMITVS
jgi:hypothetical protein